MSQPHIHIHHLTYNITQDKPLFKELSLSLMPQKIGLVGRNGMGKSTLLKLIVGQLKPDSGHIEYSGKLTYLAQEFHADMNKTVAEIFNVADKKSALLRIQSGSMDEKDFDVLADDWEFESPILKWLSDFGLPNISLDRKLNTLSGGEITRIYLARCFSYDPDFILLDEPTNNLDKKSKEFLYHVISTYEKGLLIVSHDRKLLNLMDEIVELTSIGINIYGGNFDHYHEQKQLMREASVRQLEDAKKSLKRMERSIQESTEKHADRQKHGRSDRNKGSIGKMAADFKKGRSERTQSALRIKEERMANEAKNSLDEAKDALEILEEIHVSLPKTHVHNKKMVLNISDLSFSYPNLTKPLIEHFNFTIQGAEKIAIIGDNGCGKTTLVKLIKNELTPTLGTIYRGVDNIRYLDQSVSLLEPELSVLENFKRLNPSLSETEARLALAQFLFRNVAALKYVKNLSGGEKLRAALACVLMSENPPQLLILDEPTNHLDLSSIAAIEAILLRYEGALLVISHDETFLKIIGIERIIEAPFYE